MAIARPGAFVIANVVQVVFALKFDLKMLNLRSFGLFSVPTRLLDLANHARVHQFLSLPQAERHASRQRFTDTGGVSRDTLKQKSTRRTVSWCSACAIPNGRTNVHTARRPFVV